MDALGWIVSAGVIAIFAVSIRKSFREEAEQKERKERLNGAIRRTNEHFLSIKVEELRQRAMTNRSKLVEAKGARQSVMIQTDDGECFWGTVEELDDSTVMLRKNGGVVFGVPIREIQVVAKDYDEE